MVLTGDVLDVLPSLEADSFDAMLTDPPYGLEFMGRDWDRVVPTADVWGECLRVLKPGAFALVFGGTRTWHRLAVALEDAGFEVRDTLMWLYGSGFPKSHDVSKAIDKHYGAEREVLGPNRYDANRKGTDLGRMNDDGWTPSPRVDTAPATADAARWQGFGTALKPAWEPVLLVRKPTALTFAGNALEFGCGALNIDASRVPTDEAVAAHRNTARNDVYGTFNEPYAPGDNGKYVNTSGRWPANVLHDGSEEVTQHFPRAKSGGTPPRRLPDKARAVYGAFSGQETTNGVGGTTGSAARFFYCAKASTSERNAGLDHITPAEHDAHNLSSNACARCGLRVKANGSGKKCECGPLRETVKLPPKRNPHPTVKPIALTEYLARLLLPPPRDTPRRILIPFAGSGSEIIGAIKAGWDEPVGIEREAEYATIAHARITHHTAQPTLVATD